MEERNAPLEVPASSELDSKKNSEIDYSSSSTSRQDVNDVSMPICFLVKEQAKSLVAIQDLQKRVENIENIQDDVIDSLAEIRKFLCNDSKTFSDSINSLLNASNPTPPSVCISKPESFFSKSIRCGCSSKDSKCAAFKECGLSKSSAGDISGHSQKHLESQNKELALESDKQDSGLDSDCREIHDHLSLKHSVNSVKPESGDELLQLLDEISQRTQVLQKQLAVIDHKTCEEDGRSDFFALQTNKHDKISFHQDGCLKASLNCLNCSRRFATMEESMAKKSSFDVSPEHIETKSLTDRVHKIQKRAANKIDSTMVSSILKETNVVDLQRQVLIYLVENAVLHTKLGELEQILSSKALESNKIENSLKDETRLLMMENRELRISLDEQKLESNSLRSKVLMLERVLQSVSVENRELTWQLSESLGIQNLSRKEPRKFSSFGSSGNSKFTRRSSMPPQYTCQNEANVNCVKSKLLSGASGFLDVTAEEPEQHWSEIHSPYENHTGPVQSSTPYTKLKDIKTSVINPPSSFQSVKRRFKPTEKDSPIFKNRNLEKQDEIPRDNHSETCAKSVKFTASNFDESAAKFPFNSILEKLKSNSDYRLSKRTSLTQTNEVNFSGDPIKSVSFNKTKLATSEGEDSVASSENIRQTGQAKNFQSRKGKNIHQRIQDILDRIMSESEEAT